MSAIGDWLDGRRDRLRWIEATAYANRLFGSGESRGHDPNAIAAILGQAQQLLDSDVVTVDAGAILLADVGAADGEPVERLAAALGDDTRTTCLEQAIDALAHAVDRDLVLCLPGPADAIRIAGGDDEAAADFGNLDDTGVAFTDVLRAVSEKPLAAVVFRFTAPPDDDERDGLGPALSVADHYGWPVVSVAATPDAADPDAYPGSAVLYPDCLPPSDTASKRTGGGLTAAFWTSDAAAAPECACRYGAIPSDAVPETVLAQRRKLDD